MGKQAFATTLALLLILILNPVSAVIVDSVRAESFSPGKQASVEITLENALVNDVEDVTLNLDFTNLPFIPIGSSSAGFDEIESDKDARATFIIRAANDISPGDYQIPYTITYFISGEETERKREGSIGISVFAQPSLSYTINTENPVIGQEGTIIFKIVNSGFADAKFVSVKAIPDGFTILSENEAYIGTIDSDDFETAEFDVIFKSSKPRFSAIVEYTDFNNEKITKTIEMPVTVYTKEKAIELGIIEKNNTPLYIGAVLAILILWFVWRAIAKRRRLKRSQRS
ncbi:hypothetical protein CO038_02670 [Candidatus Pacearchaeota archaeon CG_4_9_14_0_2_um_filter_39_13]|nr:hypothetical protein [Candidatus Pacearchaeota archaeon]OIO44425.1 MAG: hypothetical protein AUJ64_00080 [Candidatus Pacearchaeota archaeon CG1_02_39_14]PJC44649.1 MAG: hypothetical protein CO038_02670 [Candidatus Pacearchaeota archaeon CG_4_9_14_0_2_um_filter_39_13]